MLDVNFVLEADAGLDFGAIDLVIKNKKAQPAYKDEQRYVPSISNTCTENLFMQLVTSRSSRTKVFLI